jgi:hypothetical protein
MEDMGLSEITISSVFIEIPGLLKSTEEPRRLRKRSLPENSEGNTEKHFGFFLGF